MVEAWRTSTSMLTMYPLVLLVKPLILANKYVSQTLNP